MPPSQFYMYKDHLLCCPGKEGGVVRCLEGNGQTEECVFSYDAETGQLWTGGKEDPDGRRTCHLAPPSLSNVGRAGLSSLRCSDHTLLSSSSEKQRLTFFGNGGPQADHTFTEVVVSTPIHAKLPFPLPTETRGKVKVFDAHNGLSFDRTSGEIVSPLPFFQKDSDHPSRHFILKSDVTGTTIRHPRAKKGFF